MTEFEKALIEELRKQTELLNKIDGRLHIEDIHLHNTLEAPVQNYAHVNHAAIADETHGMVMNPALKS